MSYNYQLEKIRKNPNYIQRIANPTQKEFHEAVKGNGMLLYLVSVQNNIICEAAVSQNPQALTFVEAKNQNNKLCEIAIKQDGMCIQYVDKKTAKLCNMAVEQTSGAIAFVPKKFQTDALKLVAIKNDPNILQMIEDQDEYICLEAIKVDPRAIVHVKNQTPKIIMEALKTPNTQNFIDFTKYSIQSVCHVPSGQVYHIDGTNKPLVTSNVPIGSALKQKQQKRRRRLVNKEIPVEKLNKGSHTPKTNLDFVEKTHALPQNVSKTTNNPIFVNGFVNYAAGSIKPLPKKRMIKFLDVRKNVDMFVNEDSILSSVRSYIKRRYGIRCLEQADEFEKNSATVTMVTNDNTFPEGAFYIKINDDNYEVYLKTTSYEKGWFTGKYHKPSVSKVREYTFICSE
jgi:hypothetical protein